MRFQSHITPSRIYDEIKMIKNRPFLLVEGESDVDFFVKFIDTNKCSIKATFGNPNLIAIFDMIKKNGDDVTVLGVIDADFRRIDGNLPTYDNIFLTDTHDLETMIMQSDALELVANKFCRKKYILTQKDDELKDTVAQKEAFLQARKQTLREFLTALVLPIAYFKYLSDTKSYAFKFKRNPLDKKDERPDYKKFIDKEKMVLDKEKMIQEIKNCSENGLKSRAIPNLQIISEMEEIAQKLASFDVWEVCNGHHITNILSVSFMVALSKYNPTIDSKEIENELITNYDSMYFRNTNLYKSLKNWEATHVIIFKEF